MWGGTMLPISLGGRFFRNFRASGQKAAAKWLEFVSALQQIPLKHGT
jgi:hypothetical protein